jgi:hypothetical protein
MATIVRGPRAADHYTIISNSALRDERLSWKARGLLAYLLSMETGWETSVRRLATVAPDGKSAVETALAELQAAGYLERVQTRGAGDKPGTFSHTEYHVCDDAAVTRFSGHGDDEPTVTRFSVDGSSVPGESATKKNSPKKTSTKEDRSAALRAATASPVETSSSSSTSRNASDRDDAAAAKAPSTTRAGATRGTTPATALEAAGLDTTAAGRFRAWLVTGTGATNPDGLIVTLHNTGRLPERLSQWRASEDPTQVPGPGRVLHMAWCGDCDRATRTAVAHDTEGREYVRRCPVCNVNATSTTPGPSRAARGPATATSDDTTGDAYEAARAARAALPAGVRRRRTTIGNVVDIATVRATQGSDQ